MDRFPYSTLNRKHHPDIFSLLLTCHFDVATTRNSGSAAVKLSQNLAECGSDRSARQDSRLDSAQSIHDRNRMIDARFRRRVRQDRRKQILW
jgi:hypothetical protein